MLHLLRCDATVQTPDPDRLLRQGRMIPPQVSENALLMDGVSIDAWLEPLDGEACGEDLEYDPTFLELSQAAAGKPETQFGPAEPPQWPLVRELAEGLLTQSRDLRVALIWGRAVISLEGLAALPAALQLLIGLLDRFWDEVHPRNDPDDGDAFARISVLGSLDKLDGMLGDVRQALVLNDRRLGGLRLREIEIALDRLAPRADESARTPGQIQGLLGEFAELGDQLRACHAQSMEAIKQLQRLMNDRFGMDSAVDLKAMRGMLDAVAAVLPQVEATEVAADGSDTAPGAGEGNAQRSGSGSHGINSRQDAIKAINLICAYLERSEPTNPAQLLLRRAERLIEKNFLQLVRDLAPEAVAEVARIMGVDPDSVDA
ncbi:MAG: type VI secretion system protein TssA [Rubrivivax sp.]